MYKVKYTLGRLQYLDIKGKLHQDVEIFNPPAHSVHAFGDGFFYDNTTGNIHLLPNSVEVAINNSVNMQHDCRIIMRELVERKSDRRSRFHSMKPIIKIISPRTILSGTDYFKAKDYFVFVKVIIGDRSYKFIPYRYAKSDSGVVSLNLRDAQFKRESNNLKRDIKRLGRVTNEDKAVVRDKYKALNLYPRTLGNGDTTEDAPINSYKDDIFDCYCNAVESYLDSENNLNTAKLVDEFIQFILISEAEYEDTYK